MSPTLTPTSGRLQSHFGLRDPRLQSPCMPQIIPLTVASTPVTLTSPQLLQGFINVTVAAAATITLPTAADLVNNVQGAMVGTSFEFEVRATGAGGATVAVPAGGGVTISGTATVATANSKTFLVNFTNVGIGTEAYTVYSKGAGTF